MAIQTVQTCDGCGKPTRVSEKSTFRGDIVQVITIGGERIEACSYQCARKATMLHSQGKLNPSVASRATMESLWGVAGEERVAIVDREASTATNPPKATPPKGK